MTEQSRRDFIRIAGTAALVSAVTGCATSGTRRTSFDDIPRLELTRLPTACQKMNNLSAAEGWPDLYIKRDDVMELAAGGNKTRKMEYALAQALNEGAQAVVTQGGLQSNHVRQTCSGAAKVGLEAHVVLSNPVPEMLDELKASGNYLMDQLMGANMYFAEDGRGPVVEQVLADLGAAGKKPYNIPAGASNGVGSLGYVNAARELIDQWRTLNIAPSHIFTASGSCGTQAGLLMGLRYFGNSTTKVVGISVSGAKERTEERMRSVLNQIADELGVDYGFIPDGDIIVYDDYIGEGYGRPTEAGVAAIHAIGRQEGIILDPIYTGKGMSGMLDLLRKGALDEPRDVVFLHTGGSPAIHPYAEFLV